MNTEYNNAELDFDSHKKYFDEKIDPKKHIVQLPDGIVQIKDTAGTIFRIIREERRYFYRGGQVVQLREDSNERFVLDYVTAEMAVSEFSRSCSFLKSSNKSSPHPRFEPADLPVTLAKSILQSYTAQNLYRIRGIFNCPIITASSSGYSVLLKGYDEETESLVTFGEVVPDVPLKEAKKSILDLLGDFDFLTGSDKSRALASTVSPAFKMGSILGECPFPIDIGEADKSFAGKTYRVKIIAAIYNELPALIGEKDGGVGSTDETLGSHLLDGRLFISYDNFRGRLNSTYLEQLLTSEKSFPVRVPYKGKIEVDPSFTTLFLTSNNFDSTPDLANRSSIVRIRAQSKDYEYKEYDEGIDTLNHIKNNQPYYLGCVFSVAGHYIEEGMQKTKEPRHGFTNWTRSMDWIVQKIFNLNPLMDGHEAAQNQISTPAFNFLRLLAIAAKKSGLLNKDLTSKNLFHLCIDHGIEIAGKDPGFYQDDSKGSARITTILRPLFVEKNPITLDDYTVERSSTKKRRSNSSKGYVYPDAFNFKIV